MTKSPSSQLYNQLPASHSENKQADGHSFPGPNHVASCRCAEGALQPQQAVGARTANITTTLRCQGSACHRQSLHCLLCNSYILHSSPGTAVLRSNGRGGCYGKGWNTIANSLPGLPGTQIHSFHTQLLHAQYCIPYSGSHCLMLMECLPRKSIKLCRKWALSLSPLCSLCACRSCPEKWAPFWFLPPICWNVNVFYFLFCRTPSNSTGFLHLP